MCEKEVYSSVIEDLELYRLRTSLENLPHLRLSKFYKNDMITAAEDYNIEVAEQMLITVQPRWGPCKNHSSKY